jgi:cytochrome P450 family 628
MTPDRPDVFTWILEAFESKEAPSIQDRMDLVGDAYLIVVAGSDTTAATLTCLFFMLATHPQALKKLQAEVDAYHLANEGLGFESTSLAKLPYLDAVINESLRLQPTVPSGVQRETPPEGLRIGDVYIPGKTIVQIPTYSIQRGKSTKSTEST